MSDFRQLVLDHSAQCSHCGRQLVAGDLVSVDETEERVTCLACLGEPTSDYEPGLDTSAGFGIGTPGGSAQREYERRRESERQTAKQQRGIRLAFVALAAVGGYVAVQVFAAAR